MDKFSDEDMKKYCLIKADKPDKCMMCKEDTLYIEYISESRLCSEACNSKLYELIDAFNSCPN
jgi:hypothetical protein